jgi:hypothetical protein
MYQPETPSTDNAVASYPTASELPELSSDRMGNLGSLGNVWNNRGPLAVEINPQIRHLTSGN